jgi:glycerol-3-phosphate dehydrogenase
LENIYDVLIIGAGVVGSAVAREFSRYELHIAVLEKELDVCMETSGRNTGVLHGGFTYKLGSLKAQCCVEGNREFDRVAQELDVPFKRTGKVVVGFDEKDMQSLLKYKRNGEANGVQGLEIIDKARLQEMAPSAGGEFAMYSPASGMLNPFVYTVALAENAAQNGVHFYFDHEVTGIRRHEGLYSIQTNQGRFCTRWVVNCAGLNSVQVSEMLGIGGYTLGGFKGEYFVLDKKAGKELNMLIYPAPGPNGGFATHATPTVDGNVLIGPDSRLVDDFEDYRATPESLKQLVLDGKKMFKYMKREYFIRNFSGIRPKLINKDTKEILDFVVEARKEAPNSINLVGIESPGLTSALPLARRAVALMREQEKLLPNRSFNPRRRGILCFAEQSEEKKKALIKENPDYGEIVCRCETVTRAEIVQAIRNPLGVRSLIGIKNRTRAMMGRCQGGYCETRLVEIMEEELQESEKEIVYGRKGGKMFTGKVRA